MTETIGRQRGQVLMSLLTGLLIWEIAGWHFNSAFFAPVLGSDVPLTNWLANTIAGLFGIGISEQHPGTLPRLLAFLAIDDMVAAWRESASAGHGLLTNFAAAIGGSELITALGQSLSIFLTGLVFATLLGLLLGMTMARFGWLRIALEHYILALYSTPMAALIPFILAIFGFEFWPKVLVVFLFTLFPVLYNTLEGARSLKPEYVEVARSFRTSERRLWTDIIIPFTLPFAMTGLRQGLARALVGMVAAEILLNPTGIGDLLVGSSRAFDMAGVLASIVVVTVLGAVMMATVRMFEDRYVKWRNAAR
jgi:ABC-type nitrate/sulfonate/bicarbonate transport system permease component